MSNYVKRFTPEERRAQNSARIAAYNAARWEDPENRRQQSERMKGNQHGKLCRHDEQWRRKNRKPHSGNAHWGRGKPLAEEHKAKIGASHTGKKRPPFSDEWKKKIGIGHIGCTMGEKNAMWRGGTTALRKQIRDSYKYRDWRTAVFKRDDFTCQHCQQRGGRLQVDHHPRTFERIIRENQIKTLDGAHDCAELWDTDNGRTLCHECHRKTQTWGGRKREKVA